MPPRSPYPSEEELHAARMEQVLLGVRTSFPARVQAFDATTQCADLVPLLRRQVPQADGSLVYEDQPVLPSVEIIFPRSGTAVTNPGDPARASMFVSLPIQPGDFVLVICCDGDVGTWRRGDGDISTPRDLRMHHLTNAVAIPGLYPHAQALRGASLRAADASIEGAPARSGIVMGSDAADGTRLLMKPDNALEVVHGTAPVFRIEPGAPPASPDFVALAAKVNQAFADLRAAFDAWTVVPNDGGAALKTALASWTPASVAAAKVKAT